MVSHLETRTFSRRLGINLVSIEENIQLASHIAKKSYAISDGACVDLLQQQGYHPIQDLAVRNTNWEFASLENGTLVTLPVISEVILLASRTSRARVQIPTSLLALGPMSLLCLRLPISRLRSCSMSFCRGSKLRDGCGQTSTGPRRSTRDSDNLK